MVEREISTLITVFKKVKKNNHESVDITKVLSIRLSIISIVWSKD